MVPQLGGPGPPAVGGGGALSNAIAMVWCRRGGGGGKGERERGERMMGGGDGTNATVDGSPIETLPGTLCATSNPPPRAPRRQRVRSGDDASSSTPTVRFPVEVASSPLVEHVLLATTPLAHACNVSAESCIGSDVVVAVLRDDADAAFAVVGVDASAAVLRRPRNASFSSRMRQNLWAA